MNEKTVEILDDEVVKYDDAINSLVTEYKTNIDLAEKSNEASESVFFELGKKLVTIESEILNSHPENKIKAKKLFAAFKIRTAKKIDKHSNNLDKVVKVAKFCETANYTKYQNRLPSGWGALYLVCGLEDEKLDGLMLDSEINSEIVRTKLAEKVKSIKHPEAVKKDHKVKITIEGGAEPTVEELAKLQKYLKGQKEFKRWQISSPELVTEEINL
jgi:hypothetical protein